jgi:hypothetical protein
VNLGRSLAVTAFLMAKTSAANQSWRSAQATIETQKDGRSKLVVNGLDLNRARCVWESDTGDEVVQPAMQPFTHSGSTKWIEAEAWWPDGRRVFATTNP